MVRKDLYLLLLIIVLSLTVRLLVYQGYSGSDAVNYVEESYNILNGHYSVAERLSRIPLDEIVPSPLFNYQNLRLGFLIPNVLSMKIFGVNEFALSIFPFFCSVLMIVSVFLLGREMYSPKAGLTAAVFVAFVPQDVNLSSAFLPHMPAASFMALSSWMFVKAIKRFQSGIKASAASMFFSGLATCYAYTMWEFAIFFLPVLALYLFIYFGSFSAFRSKEFWLLGFSFLAGFMTLFGVETFYFFSLSGAWVLRPRLISLMGKLILDVHPIDSQNINYWVYPSTMVKSYYFGMFFYLAFGGLLAWLYAACTGKSDGHSIRLQSLPVIWLLFLLFYLQWGSSSFSQYFPTFKLVTYLTVLSAPGALLSAFLMHWILERKMGLREGILKRYRYYFSAVFISLYIAISAGSAFINHWGNGPFRRDQVERYAIIDFIDRHPDKPIYTDGWTARLLSFTSGYTKRIFVFDRLDPYDKRELARLENMKNGYVLMNYERIRYASKAYKRKTYPDFVFNCNSHDLI